VITFHETCPRWSKPEAVLNFDRSSSDTPLSTAEEGQTEDGAVLIRIGIAFQLSLVAPCREINWVIGKIFFSEALPPSIFALRWFCHGPALWRATNRTSHQ
jgi:hypothetical protein